jgi:hypothetical protein
MRFIFSENEVDGNDFKCPYCKVKFEYPGCKHTVFIYDGTNSKYLHISPDFKPVLIQKIKNNPHCWSFMHIKNNPHCWTFLHDEWDDISEENIDYWLDYIALPPVAKEFQGLFPEIDFYELCSTDHRSYYYGVSYGVCSEELRANLINGG